MTHNEKYIRKCIEDIYPQLVINAHKTCTTGFEKYGLDLITTAVEFFLNKPEEQQLETIENGKLENFITFIMAVQLKSTSSRFYNEMRKHTNSIREFWPNYQYEGMEFDPEEVSYGDNNDMVWECVKEITKDFNPFEKMVYEEILRDGGKYATVSKKYNINYHHLRDTAEQIRTTLQHKCEKYLEYDNTFDY